LSWTDLTLGLIEEAKPSPPQAARALALVHVAMAEAANAGNQPTGAAITGAAAAVLEQLFPQAAAVPSAWPQAANPIAAAEEALRRSPAWTHGHARQAGQINLNEGRRIGQQMLAWAQADGSGAAWDGERPVGTGLWQPTPPAYREDPLEPMAGQWRPWVLPSGDALRPAPPPVWGSPSWEAELKGVQEAVAQRTPEQAAAVKFWAGGPGTVTPAGIWIRIARDLIVRDGLDARGAAHVLALTSVAMADAFIYCWDTKYAYWSARPVTADPTLDVLIPTPPFPSYPSGHSTISAAAATVLSHFFPEDAPTLLQQADEAKNSRLWAGIHFPIDNEVGARAGLEIGRLVIERSAETGVAWNLDGRSASAPARTLLSLRKPATLLGARAMRQPAPGVAAR
jgi:hypothetical protein